MATAMFDPARAAIDADGAALRGGVSHDGQWECRRVDQSDIIGVQPGCACAVTFRDNLGGLLRLSVQPVRINRRGFDNLADQPKHSFTDQLRQLFARLGLQIFRCV